MRVTVDVKGEATHEIDTDELPGDSTSAAGQSASSDGTSNPESTYADLLTAVDLSPHEVSVLVDGRPVPEDQPVDADHVTVLRLIKGG
ncbi:hypothetical protein D8Y22_11770 [Salinadaptatus halalkaliphilus]|uniref:GP-PDE domain-containing protein n=1 Tax=Salinadaptatus halalkaliphilus TaxID=2419781 RepID=A0A4S3TNI7_9EURY|nr:ubiquitin-like small modifier protein 2 [Salinadaptatus halalkaliphilus]THE64675.1 hypothetical protein D8Y22_11770 [Salinadaptatus halalkaliphilus]